MKLEVRGVKIEPPVTESNGEVEDIYDMYLKKALTLHARTQNEAETSVESQQAGQAGQAPTGTSTDEIDATKRSVVIGKIVSAVLENDQERFGGVNDNRTIQNDNVCRPKVKTRVDQSGFEDDTKCLKSEMLDYKFSSLRLSALKAVQTVLSSQKYGEMLLVPKTDLVADSSKALADGTVVRKDEDFKKIICDFMKKLISVATSPSAFKRFVTVVELDRTQDMLLKLATQEHAERETKVAYLKGNFFFIMF